jgi:hypothetical protein
MLWGLLTNVFSAAALFQSGLTSWFTQSRFFVGAIVSGMPAYGT